jgi:metallo-beta-lactamase class B
MKRYLSGLICSGLLLVSGRASSLYAQFPDATAQKHVAAAKALAATPKNATQPWQNFDYVVDTLCAEPKLGAPAGPPPAAPANTAARPRADWFIEPVKVFDNLYYLGTNKDAIWAVTTSAGIILVDSNFHWNVEELVVDGLKKFGLNAADIKYLVITHAHSDHYWGAKFLQDKFHPRILMSEADWNVVAKDNTPAELKPKKDMVITDGQKLTLGDTTISLYVTPGHTPGTVSMILPLKDGNERHVGGMFGGFTLGIARAGVNYYPDWPTELRTYQTSISRFQEIEAKAGVDTIISIHSLIDHTTDKLAALKMRKPGEPHPFVNKELPKRLRQIVNECLQAQMAWRTKS